MTSEVVFSPLLNAPWLYIVALGLFVAVVVSLISPLSGRYWRALAALIIGFAMLGPSLQQRMTEDLPSIVAVLVDQTASAQLGARADQVAEAEQQVLAQLSGRDDVVLRQIPWHEDPDRAQSLLRAPLTEALRQIPADRLGGVIVISDGIVTDTAALPEIARPLHLLRAAESGEWDQRLVVETAPAYGIVGEPLALRLRAVREGAVPDEMRGRPVELLIELDNATTRRVQIPSDEVVELTITPQHVGANLLRLSVPLREGELTAANNAALVDVTGIRDRLRVLLVSGTPHAGERVWRNLLKSDSAVDLVHFTILRPLGKQDGVPVNELSLIAFPTQELFMDKIDQFDLIIFDRYRLQGILPPLYLQNMVQFVEQGGSLLVAAGPEYASVASLYRSPLATILPAAPDGQVIEQGYVPSVSELGARHPVTQKLGSEAEWGRWYRRIGLSAVRGDVIMQADEEPLLVLDRVGQGRVAVIASDQIWLWARGHDGGGPHRELLRRLAHWLMQEPDLDEERLQATSDASGALQIERRTMGTELPALEITGPSGAKVTVDMQEVSPGHFVAEHGIDEEGLYTLRQGTRSAVIGVGAARPEELAQVIGATDVMLDAVRINGGAVFDLEDGVPDLRLVSAGRQSAGPGWAGLVNGAVQDTLSIEQRAMLPPWLALVLAAGCVMAGWLREGRRG